jgi:hypothetical protein
MVVFGNKNNLFLKENKLKESKFIKTRILAVAFEIRYTTCLNDCP